MPRVLALRYIWINWSCWKTGKKNYDVDTILLYSDEADPLALSAAADQLAETGVLLTKSMPPRLTCRRVMRFQNGRITEIENHG